MEDTATMATELDPTHDPAEALGIGRAGRTHWNLVPAALYEEALRRQEGSLAADGPLVCRTGQHTGRSPNDKFVVREPSTEHHIHWGAVNRAIDEASFDALHGTCRRISRTRIVFVARRAGRALTRRSKCPFASSPSSPGTTSSRETCSCPSTTRHVAGAPTRVHRHRRAEFHG